MPDYLVDVKGFSAMIQPGYNKNKNNNNNNDNKYNVNNNDENNKYNVNSNSKSNNNNIKTATSRSTMAAATCIMYKASEDDLICIL